MLSMHKVFVRLNYLVYYFRVDFADSVKTIFRQWPSYIQREEVAMYLISRPVRYLGSFVVLSSNLLIYTQVICLIGQNQLATPDWLIINFKIIFCCYTFTNSHVLLQTFMIIEKFKFIIRQLSYWPPIIIPITSDFLYVCKTKFQQ